MLVSRTATMLRAVPSRMRTGGAGLRMASSLASPSPRPKPCARAVQSPFSVGLGASPPSPIMSTVALLSRARAASTTPTPAQVQTPRPASRQAEDDKAMDWNTFFKLRKQRRRLQLAFSTVACFGGGTAGAIFLSTGALDRLVAQFPLDPFITLGLMTFSAAALGWLLGPIIGTTVFYMFKRSIQKEMTKKEVQFFARIKKNRVDPSSASASNPVPDFYGEKIQSVAGYRQWLKDQRVFRKKRTTFI
ncbi:hypothetical protein MAPG_03524 [Magnaporthiopsis poae ATCC 64411]|uniref:Presequence translocated-associated motor subunit PAM17 n=1 Tax=Magnaporthiopsis poae (strain ATCC 64411 / 73-15) TaxID=644358 RepID=A0A0C4DU87_MAGP6|nr:hypothetical protein MAPG_03524 [Magnaporthiopsis poae ATCC 64411]